jgi:hypothetical protein
MAEETLKPAEWEKLFAWIQNLIGHQLPWYIKLPFGILVLSALTASILVIVFASVSKIKEIWFEKLLPYTYRAEQRQRVSNRSTFARYLSREIVNRNLAERWRDEEFADLEAEVEAEGDWRSFLPFIHRRGLRRERSLSRALEKSTERLILLEGDPGSGKSVAMRHVAYRMADAAADSRHIESKLPIFVNLKEIKRISEEKIDRSLIRNLVFETIKRVNDHFVDEFLDDNFDEGVKKGLFVFFFDSFDEIPDVLSSTQADDVIDAYSRAISDFLSGMNECRGIIASRSYRGPERQGWRTFRILELSSTRQQALVRRAFAIKPELAPKLLGELSLAPEDVRAMARNPMLLGLLCEHLRLGNEFPSSTYEVFSHYVEHRFERDAERVKSRHGLSTDEVRAWAERAAFVMTLDPALGLSPRRGDLRSALTRAYTRLSLKTFDSSLDALEYIKFGRSDGSTEIGSARQFTFSHRRFQEYFTTRVVIAQPDRISPHRLLTDARWRETAVVLLQSGSENERTALLAESERLLQSAVQHVVPPSRLEQASGETISKPEVVTKKRPNWEWPPRILHVLGIIQAGLGSRVSALPASVTTLSARLLRAATEHGDLLDRKLALEVAGTAPQEVLLELIRSSLTIDSQWLNDVTYTQIARLSEIPQDVLSWIRIALLRWGLSGQLARNWHGVRTHLSRLGADHLISSARMARWVVYLDLGASIALTIGITYYSLDRLPRGVEMMFWMSSIPIVIILVLLYWKLWNGRPKAEVLRFLIIFYLCGGVSLVGEDQHKSQITMMIIILTAMYLASYGAAAARCVTAGIFVLPLFWAFLPIIYIVELAKFARQRFKRIITLLTGSVFVGGVLYICRYYLSKLLDTYFGLLDRMLYVFFFVIISVAVFWIYLYLRYPIEWLRDVRRFKLLSQSKIPMNSAKFWAAYTSLETSTWKVHFVRQVRMQNKLEMGEGLEYAIRVRISEMQTLDSDVRDELYMLLENLTRDQRSNFFGRVTLRHKVAPTDNALRLNYQSSDKNLDPDDINTPPQPA